MLTIAHDDLYRACRVLFGTDHAVGPDFLATLHPIRLKKAYHRMARATHPDMHTHARRSSTASAFLEVRDAYERLSRYLAVRGRPNPVPWRTAAGGSHAARPTAPPVRPKPAQPPPVWEEQPRNVREEKGENGKKTVWANGFYHGTLPRRKLLLGHFLYYTGRSDWRTLIKSLGWQNMGRPRMGDLALRFGWLRPEDVLRVLRNRRALERFGDISRRMGLLSEFQVRVLLAAQRRRQQRLGRYFVEAGMLSETEVETLVRQCQEHNQFFP